MPARPWICAAAAAALLVLPACSADPEVDPRPTPSSSSSEQSPTPSETPTPTPTATIPALPPEAQTQDAAGAEAFVRHWFDLLNYGYSSGSIVELRAASEPDCAECQDFYGLVEDLASAGEYTTGPALNIEEMTSAPPEGSRALVVLSYVELEVTVVGREGQTRLVGRGNTLDAGAVVTWSNGWRLANLGAA